MNREESAWCRERLATHATVKARLGWKGLKAEEYVSSGYVFLAAPNLKGHDIDFENVNYISERRYVESPEIMLKPGDVLLVKDGSTLGMANLVRSLPIPTTVNGSIAVIRCCESLVPAFLHHVVQGKDFQKLIRVKKGGLGVPHLFQADLREFELPVPPLPEQRRIAEILDSVDDVIRKTEQVVAKLGQMKQGLLHDLLTRGIDDKGELRDSERHPEQFKDLTLGRMPRGWEFGGVLDVQPSERQCILTGPFGAQLGRSDFVSDGVPVLRVGNVQWGHLDLSDLVYVTPAKAKTLERFRIRTGDLLFARQGATTGRNALADQAADGAIINYHIIRVATDQARCHPTYLYACFNSDLLQAQVDQEKGRGTREGVNSRTVAGFRFPLPPVDEQRRIAATLEAFDARVEVEETELEKLCALKQGLMDNLLTGRVRVR